MVPLLFVGQAATVLACHVLARDSLEDIVSLVRLFVLPSAVASSDQKALAPAAETIDLDIVPFLQSWSDMRTNDRRVGTPFPPFPFTSWSRSLSPFPPPHSLCL